MDAVLEDIAVLFILRGLPVLALDRPSPESTVLTTRPSSLSDIYFLFHFSTAIRFRLFFHRDHFAHVS